MVLFHAGDILTGSLAFQFFETGIEDGFAVEATFVCEPDEGYVGIGRVGCQSNKMLYSKQIDKVVEVHLKFFIQQPRELIGMNVQRRSETSQIEFWVEIDLFHFHPSFQLCLDIVNIGQAEI